MRKREKWAAIIFVQMLYALAAGSVFPSGQQAKIKIVTSIYPFYEFARKVGGERGEVRILIPPGSEVHTWKPRPSDILELNEADLFIGVGSILEPWLDDILESVDNPGLQILEADKIVPALEHKKKGEGNVRFYEGQDPHIWLDFLKDIQIVAEIREVLTDFDPSSAVLFAQNADAYIERLKSLDERYRETLQSCSTRILLLGGHSAFGHLAGRYGLDQIAVFGTSPDAQPSPRQVVDFIQLARSNGVKAVFYERAVSPDIARVIAREIDAQVLPLNPAASLSGDELRAGLDFIRIMEINLENLRIGLRCK